jgi:hypothetical protein
MAQRYAKKPKLIKLHCNGCRHATNHKILKSRSRSGTYEEEEIDWSITYDMLECCGCEEVVLRRDSSSSDDPYPEISYFPPRTSRWVPSWRWTLPTTIRELLTEVYTALQANSLSIAMMGARAIIETAMVSKVGDQGTFPANLQAMERGGFLSKTNREYLSAALDAGSASIHRAHRPDKSQLDTIMDITENLLQSLFVLGKRTKLLRALTPPRPIKKSAP